MEVIAHLYEEYGVDCLNHLRGMFAFALWDKKKKQLFLARDRLGIKPLHYAIGKDKTLYFGSEQKTILIADTIEREINTQALYDLFTFGFTLTPRTLFRHIHRIPPGHYVLYKQGHISIKRYWDLSFPEKHQRKQLSEEAWTEELLERLKEVVKIHMRSDVPVGAWLSAGIDSSAVVALMKSVTNAPTHTFSLAFEDQPSYDEVTNQKTLDQFPGFKIPNERVVVKQEHFDLFKKTLWHIEDPTTSGVHMVRLLLSEATSRKFKVVLTGEGADEIFGGYPWYRFDKFCRPFAVLPKPIRQLMLLGPVIPKWKPWSSSVFLAPRPMNLRRYAALLGSFGKENMMSYLFSDHLREKALTSRDGYLNLTAFPEFRHWHNFEKIQYMETKTRLVDYIVRDLDRTSMAHSIEARVPFLDHELVEFCTRIPPSLKMKYLKEKYIFRKAVNNHLPPEIVHRKKRGLVAPSSPWLRDKLSAFMQEMFSEEQLRKKGYFNPSFVKQLLDKHRAKKGNYTRALMAILSVQVWDELFIKGCKPTGDVQDAGQ